MLDPPISPQVFKIYTSSGNSQIIASLHVSPICAIIALALVVSY